MARKVETDVTTILKVAMLTAEDLGTTGSLIREALWEMCGREIAEADIAAWLADLYEEQIRRSGKTEEQLRAAFEARQATLPPQKRRTAEQENAAEDAHWLGKVREIVDMMRKGY